MATYNDLGIFEIGHGTEFGDPAIGSAVQGLASEFGVNIETAMVAYLAKEGKLLEDVKYGMTWMERLERGDFNREDDPLTRERYPMLFE